MQRQQVSAEMRRNQDGDGVLNVLMHFGMEIRGCAGRGRGAVALRIPTPHVALPQDGRTFAKQGG